VSVIIDRVLQEFTLQQKPFDKDRQRLRCCRLRGTGFAVGMREIRGASIKFNAFALTPKRCLTGYFFTHEDENL